MSNVADGATALGMKRSRLPSTYREGPAPLTVPAGPIETLFAPVVILPFVKVRVPLILGVDSSTQAVVDTVRAMLADPALRAELFDAAGVRTDGSPA